MSDNIRERQCTSKKLYPDKECADNGAKRLARKTQGKFESYQCYWCNGWHVGGVRNKDAAIKRDKRRNGKGANK